MELLWTRTEGLERDLGWNNVLRVWTNNTDTVSIHDVSGDTFYKMNYLVVHNSEFDRAFMGSCDAAEYVVEEYGIIPEDSVWQHQVTGNLFVVEHNNPASSDAPEDVRPDDVSEPWVYCKAPDYETEDYVWLGRRLFDNDRQLQLVDW